MLAKAPAYDTSEGKQAISSMVNLADLTRRIPDLDRAMRGLLVRERQSAWNSLSGLENTGTLSILPLQKEMLTDSLLLSLTYWVSFADLFEAGGETVGSTLSWVLLYLALNPEAQEKCYQEIL